jgi:hypothetical protein
MKWNLPSEMLNWGLTTSIRSVVTRKRTKESSNDRDNLAPIRDMHGRFFEHEEGGLGVDSIFSCVSFR